MGLPAHHTLLSLLYLAGFSVMGPGAVSAAHSSFALFYHVAVLLAVKALSETECSMEGVAGMKLQANQKVLVYQCVRCPHISKLQDQGRPGLRTC